MLKKQPPGTAAILLSSPCAGDARWWRRVAEIGTPLIEILHDEQVRLTFFWLLSGGAERERV